MSNQNRYHLENDTMFIYHDNGQVDVMVRYLGHVWTLKVTGVGKFEIEKGDDL